MTNIESKEVDVQASQAEVFTFLSDLNNFKELLPTDRISDWQSDKDFCSFKVQGTYKIRLDLKELLPPGKIILQSGEGSPFKFHLHINLDENGASTKAHQVCEADLNAFLKMMVEKPLKNLFDHIADKLKAKYD